MSAPRKLTPREVLIDLLGGADFDHEILDPVAAADLILERLADAGFAIVPAPWPGLQELHSAPAIMLAPIRGILGNGYRRRSSRTTLLGAHCATARERAGMWLMRLLQLDKDERVVDQGANGDVRSTTAPALLLQADRAR